MYVDMVMNKVCEHVFRFERVRLGKKTRVGGPYLYRDVVDGMWLASWDKPTRGLDYLYKGEDVGYNTDAIVL